jgi:hypothetical protein
MATGQQPKKGATTGTKDGSFEPTVNGKLATDPLIRYSLKPIDKKDAKGSFRQGDSKNPSIREYDYTPYGAHYELNADFPKIFIPGTTDLDTVARFDNQQVWYSNEDGPSIETFSSIESVPYPLYWEESVGVDGVFSSGRQYVGLFSYSESVNIGGALVSGSIQTLLKTYTMQTEGINVDGALVSGAIQTLLKTYTMQTEGVNIDGAFLSGSLATVLIIYPNWPSETLNISGTFVGGSLV